MKDRLVSVRGAITVENNSKDEIIEATKNMLDEIIEKNEIEVCDLVTLIFTMTRDLDKVYPAVAGRELGIVNASLMCVDELYIEGSLEKCIRVMVQFYSNKSQKDVKHIYLKGAKFLRPDLLEENNK